MDPSSYICVVFHHSSHHIGLRSLAGLPISPTPQLPTSPLTLAKMVPITHQTVMSISLLPLYANNTPPPCNCNTPQSLWPSITLHLPNPPSPQHIFPFAKPPDYQEDRKRVVEDLNEMIPEATEMDRSIRRALFCIFDGHGGDSCSDFLFQVSVGG